MEDVSDKCWYCKAILPHHRRFGPLLRTTMSYEAIKWVFVSGIARRIRGEGFSSKSNTSLLCILSRWKCSNQGSRSYPFGGNLGPALHIALTMIFFVRLKIAFWIESGERAMRGAGPSEAPSISSYCSGTGRGLQRIMRGDTTTY